MYNINGKKFEIPSKVIQSFKEWNVQTEKKNNTEFDKRMVRVILLMCVDSASLARNEIDAGTMKFITDLLSVRTSGDENRLAALEDYAKELCQEKLIEQSVSPSNN